MKHNDSVSLGTSHRSTNPVKKYRGEVIHNGGPKPAERGTNDEKCMCV
jgi:hypothetical protein